MVDVLWRAGEHSDHQFRRTVTGQAVSFGVVLALTVALVASSAM